MVSIGWHTINSVHADTKKGIRVKSWVAYIAVLIVVILVSINSYELMDHKVKTEAQIESFISKGERNTALQGFNLCVRLNALDGTNVNCKQVYYGG